jgi:glc operon protein GlcG
MHRFAIAAALVLVLLISAVTASAESAPAKLTTSDIQKVLAAAVAKAQEIGVPMGIAIVDEGGALVGFIKMDGAFNHTNHTSFSKAYTAASIRKPSGSSGIPPDITKEIASVTDGKFTTLPGGQPLMKDGKVIGGIGIGGGKSDQDEAVAKAGVDALAGK